jgi:hypothetical protein
MKWSFEREARWMIWLLLVPAAFALAALLIARLMRA